jgi:hypothetical protein
MVDVSGPHPRSLRPTYPVRSERLLLRPLAIGDADALLAYRSREDVCRSVRLARRLGMRQEARLVRNEFFKGEWSTELDFAMLAEEWDARQKE